MPLDQLLAAYGYHSNISTTPEKETQSEKESSPSVVDPANEIMFVDEEGVVSSLPPPSELICVSSEAPVNADPSNIAETAAATDPPLNESVDKQQVPCVNQSDRRSPWFRPGADPEALARLRPVPERRSIRMGAHEDENGDVVVDKTFSKLSLTSSLSHSLSLPLSLSISLSHSLSLSLSLTLTLSHSHSLSLRNVANIRFK